MRVETSPHVVEKPPEHLTINNASSAADVARGSLFSTPLNQIQAAAARVLQRASERLKKERAERERERKATRDRACAAECTSCYPALSGLTHDDSIMCPFIF